MSSSTSKFNSTQKMLFLINNGVSVDGNKTGYFKLSYISYRDETILLDILQYSTPQLQQNKISIHCDVLS